MKARRNNFFSKFFWLLAILFLLTSTALAIDLTSTNFIIRDPIIGTFGGYGTSGSFELFSAGHTALSGYSTSASYITKYGFLYFPEPVVSFITFDIDTADDFSNGESDAPYSVPLGILPPGTVVVSDTSTIKMIVLEADSSDEMVVTVANENGANGLVSASVIADNINSATASMSADTENYGLCVATAGLVGFSRSSPYDTGSCVLGSATNAVKALSSTPTNIVDSGGSALTGGHAEVVVNAAISDVTPAHDDYSDGLTFIATGTF
jgi:hypothetical protein